MATIETCRAPPVRDRTSVALTVRAVERDGTFEGYASLFNRQDMGHDIIAPGAFSDSLAQRGVRGVKMLFQHDPNQPIGIWHTLREDNRGLYATGRLIPEIAKAREVLAMMRAGVLDGLSIGFRAVNARRDRHTGVRRLMKIDLWEISIVTFPMLPDARVTAVKGKPRARASPPRSRQRIGAIDRLARKINAQSRHLDLLTHLNP